MATDTIDRELRRKLLEVLGDINAMALLGKFPPEGFTERFDAIDRRFEQVDRRFEDIDRRFEAVDRRFDELRTEMDHRFDLQDARMDAMEHRLTAVFRGELNAAITSQTRSILIALVGTVAAMGATFVGVVAIG